MQIEKEYDESLDKFKKQAEQDAHRSKSTITLSQYWQMLSTLCL